MTPEASRRDQCQALLLLALAGLCVLLVRGCA